MLSFPALACSGYTHAHIHSPHTMACCRTLVVLAGEGSRDGWAPAHFVRNETKAARAAVEALDHYMQKLASFKDKALELLEEAHRYAQHHRHAQFTQPSSSSTIVVEPAAWHSSRPTPPDLRMASLWQAVYRQAVLQDRTAAAGSVNPTGRLLSDACACGAWHCMDMPLFPDAVCVCARTPASSCCCRALSRLERAVSVSAAPELIVVACEIKVACHRGLHLFRTYGK